MSSGDISLDPRSGWDKAIDAGKSGLDPTLTQLEMARKGVRELTGVEELEKQREAMEEEAERQRQEAEEAEQEREQAEAEETRRRRGQIRSRLQEQPNLFNVLGSGQDTLG